MMENIRQHLINGVAKLSNAQIPDHKRYGVEIIKTDSEVIEAMSQLHRENSVPALSCGFHPGLVDKVNSIVGIDYMANAGGAIHGHPEGSLSGALAMRQAIDNNHGKEYEIAIKKWGYEK